MKKLYDYLMNVDEKKIIYRASFWNMIASILNSITSAVLLFFITRFCGLNEAGIFSIASAIGYQCLSLGNFGVRNFHAADVKKDFSFTDYSYVRLFSYFLLLIMLCYYAFGSGYTLDKSLAVFSFGLFKSVDVIEDLFHGEYHRNGRLDIAAILLTFRYAISIIVFVILIIVTKSITISSLITFALTFLLFFITNHDIIKCYICGNKKFHFLKFRTLLFSLIPLVITNYIKLYLTNAPKYAIDVCLGNVEQAYFNVLFMPVFIISLLSDIVFRPYISRFSYEWRSNDFEKFRSMLLRQVVVIFGITAFIIVCGFFVGFRLLEIVYSVSLEGYMSTLLFLLFGGGISTFSSFMILVMTVQREQNKMAVVTVFDLLVCLVIANPLVKSLGINGAMVLYLILNMIPAIIYTAIVIHATKVREKESEIII